MILIAGGSGLSPIYSILEDIIFNQDLEINKKQILRDVVLLFGVRTQKDLYKIEELENFKNYWKGKFEIIPVLSEEKDSDWKGKTGFVHEILDQLPNISNSQLYMCGPPIMIDKCIEVAQKHGLSSNEIYFDKFTDSSHIIKV
jgi:p-cymene monooxygenase electron transfer component